MEIILQQLRRFQVMRDERMSSPMRKSIAAPIHDFLFLIWRCSPRAKSSHDVGQAAVQTYGSNSCILRLGSAQREMIALRDAKLSLQQQYIYWMCGLRPTALAYSQIFLLHGVFRQTWEVGFRCASQKTPKARPIACTKRNLTVHIHCTVNIL